MKLLVDNCLSPELASLAQQRGHPESSHLLWLGKSDWKDWSLLPFIIGGDWTFVTKNSIDFRGPLDQPGSRGHHSRQALHAGLICLNGPPGMDLDMQLDLFRIALDAIGPDLVNRCLEVTADADGEVTIRRYELPSEDES